MKKIGIMMGICAVITMTTIAVGACGGGGTAETTQNPSQALEQYMATAETGGRDDKVPDATSEALEVVAIYTPNGDSVKINMDSVEILNEYEIAAKLQDYKVLPEGAKVDSFEMTPVESAAPAGPGASGETATQISNATLNLTGVDNLDGGSMRALVDTYIDAFNLNMITISLNGKVVATDAEFQK